MIILILLAAIPLAGFSSTSVSGSRELHARQIITYKVRPFLSIPFTWVTEITHVREPLFFVDEQRLGPFMFWHHRHYLGQLPDGRVAMADSVHYKVFYGWMSRVLNWLVLGKRLEFIFDYRNKVIIEIFNKSKA